ncbi:MAG: hypothetical protein SGILL_000738 [Bacillariaceae sp.]
MPVDPKKSCLAVTDTKWHPNMEAHAFATGTRKDQETHMVLAQFKHHNGNFRKLLNEMMEFLEDAPEQMPLEMALVIHKGLKQREYEMRTIVKTRIKTHLGNPNIKFLPGEKGTDAPIEPPGEIINLTPGQKEGIRVVGHYLANINSELDEIQKILMEPTNQTKNVLFGTTFIFIANAKFHRHLEVLEHDTMDDYQEEFIGDSEMGE